jgi:hypothetical protein
MAMADRRAELSGVQPAARQREAERNVTPSLPICALSVPGKTAIGTTPWLSSAAAILGAVVTDVCPPVSRTWETGAGYGNGAAGLAQMLCRRRRSAGNGARYVCSASQGRPPLLA